MDNILIIAMVVLAIINMIIYHKFVNVYYFNLGQGLLKEFIVAFLIAGLEILIFFVAGGWLLDTLGSIVGGIISIVGTLLLIVLGLGIILIVVALIAKVIKKVKASAKVMQSDVTDKMAEGVQEQANEEEQESAKITTETRMEEPLETVSSNSVDLEEKEENTSGLTENTMIEERIFCVNCGARIQKDVKFCNFCGHKNEFRGGMN